jgi:hypothetical protein
MRFLQSRENLPVTAPATERLPADDNDAIERGANLPEIQGTPGHGNIPNTSGNLSSGGFFTWPVSVPVEGGK